MTCAIIADYKEIAVEYDEENNPRIAELKKLLKFYIVMLLIAGYDSFYVTCEYGIPLWAAEIICGLKKLDEPVMLHIIMPYEEQASGWREDIRDRYFSVHEQCDSVKMVYTEFDEECYFIAEDILLKKCDRVLYCQRKDDDDFPYFLDEYEASRTFLYF